MGTEFLERAAASQEVQRHPRDDDANDETPDYYFGEPLPGEEVAATDDDVAAAAVAEPFASTTSHKYSRCSMVVAGQVLSLLLACSGAAQATLHYQCHVVKQQAAPTFTVGLIYLALTVVCLVPLYCKQQRRRGQKRRRRLDQNYTATSTTTINSTDLVHIDANDDSSVGGYDHYHFCGLRLHAPWYAYAGMALLDVYANYVTVLAYRYTTITSVTLLDAVAIPTALLLSAILLRRRYQFTHWLGVLLCLAGILVNVLPDVEQEENDNNDEDDEINQEYPHRLAGDALSLLGGILFGANNVLGEMAVKHGGDPDEYLGLQSFFAVIVCAVQTVCLERDAVAGLLFGDDNDDDDDSNTCLASTTRWLVVAFVASNVAGYLGGARFLLHSEAAFFNLSLLTGDAWSAAFQMMAEHLRPPASFGGAVVLTVSGVLCYELAAPAPHERAATAVDSLWSDNNIDDHDLALELSPSTTTALPTNGVPPKRQHPDRGFGLGGNKNERTKTKTTTPTEVI